MPICAVPTLKDLPLPPSGRTGWPWTEESQPLPETMPDGSEWPQISIVTPSYNQGEFIEETIRSILLQGYPNLEYIIIDGGSTDEAVKIIQKYEPWLAYWVSESDRGQTHAINKGLNLATGEILAYLNSDDYYLPGAFARVAIAARQSPNADLLHGKCRYVDAVGSKTGEQFGNITTFEEIIDLWRVWWRKRQFVQPEVFWTRRITERIGGFKEDLNFVMDYDYWTRILQVGGQVQSIHSEISCFRFTAQQKSKQSQLVADELLTVVKPIIWNRSIQLSDQQRLILQGRWLYQAVFLKQVEQSVQKSEPKVIRWIRSISVIARHPKILLVPKFRLRINSWLYR